MSGSKWSAVIIAYIGMKLSGIYPLEVLAAPINFPSWDVPMLQQAEVSLFPVEQEKLELLTSPPPTEIQSFYINGIPHNGNETRVFCYYGTPSGKPPVGGWPGIVLVHGAGGTAEH